MPKKELLKRRSDGRYACKYNGKMFYGKTSEEAIAAREAYKLGILRQARPEADTPLKLYAEYYLKLLNPSVADTTRAQRELLMTKLTDAYGDMPLNQIRPSDIKMVYTLYFAGMSNDYIKHAAQLYRGLFDTAVADGLITRNPAAERTSKPHKGTVGHHRVITEQERTWIRTLCTDHRAYPAVITMLYSGIRPPEAKALNIDTDVDFERKLIHIRRSVHVKDKNHYYVSTKCKTPLSVRDIPLLPPVEEALKGCHGLLVHSANGSPVTITGWRALWNSYVSSMETAINGVGKRWHGKTRSQRNINPWIPFTVVPYDLRHSFVAMCRDRHVELNTVIHWMGHADASMILAIYDEVTQARIDQELAALTTV